MEVIFDADVERTLYRYVGFSSDAVRPVSVQVDFSCDTTRTVDASVEIDGDAVRHLAVESGAITAENGVVTVTGATNELKQLSISLSAKTITDTFFAETGAPLELKQSVSGSVLGFDYSFLVAETSQAGDIQQITGMYDIDALLYEQIKYVAGSSVTASAHVAKIAGALGKSAVVAIDDFLPANDLSEVGVTYQALISGLFGWTDRLPQRQINVFLRGSTLYAIQRGHESGTKTIVSPYTKPTVKKKLVRVMYGTGNDGSQVTSFSVAPMPFSGSVGFGDSTCVYECGKLVSETHETEAGTELTTYSYGGNYVTSKVTQKGDGGRIEVSYSYGGFSSDELSVETQVTYDKDSKVTETRITRHHAQGGGSWVTVVEVDGETISSGVSQGRPGGKASIYSVEQANRDLGSGYSTGNDDNSNKLDGISLIDTDFPVRGSTMLADLASALNWLNGRTEERVTLDVYASTVFDFTSTVTWGDNVYFLERNTISLDPRGVKQSLDIVRWY